MRTMDKRNAKTTAWIDNHPAVGYAKASVEGSINTPVYVRKQCEVFLSIAEGREPKFKVSKSKVTVIQELLKLLIVPKGLKQGCTIYEALSGFQWLFVVAVLCVVYRDNPERRRYETAILEICRKNGKTFLVAVIFILLFFLEPRYSKFYSVAPDGALSREVQTAIREIIGSSPGLDEKFKIRRDDILCKLTDSQYFPLNYSNSRLDGKLPSVFLADEVGALPNNYAIEAMRSGQLTILNKLGCIISTKYPTIDNPFEDEVDMAKKALDGTIQKESVFALLYEPDNPKEWMTDSGVLEQSNPLALDMPEIMEDLINKRTDAISQPRKRENFLTKHCNIIYQGSGTETYIDVAALRKCKVKDIDWAGRKVWLGVDLALTTDNCAVAMAAEDNGIVMAEVVPFIPEGRIEEKANTEHVEYKEFVSAGQCIACGDQTVDYGAIEEYVLGLEEKYGVTVVGIAYDRHNAMSSAQKWERAGYEVVIVRQHSDTLHPPTKLLEEIILEGKFQYTDNRLLEINFQNSRCTYDTNLNKYVNKKRSNGKIDMVVALINAMYLLQQDVIFDSGMNFVVQVL